MNLQALVEQALRGETTFVESKTAAVLGDRMEPHPEQIAKALVALANARGGQLLLGVDSEREQITGIADEQLKPLLQKLDGILHDLVRPPLYFAAVDHGSVMDTSGAAHTVVAVDVPRSLFVHEVRGTAWIRIGSSARELKGDARARLEMQRSQTRLLRFDEMPVPACTLDDLNPVAVARLCQAARVRDLAALRLLSDVDGVMVPCVSAVLLLSDAPWRWLRGAYVQAAVFRGTRNNPDDQVDAQRFEGPLERQLIETWQFCKRYTRMRVRKDPARLDLPEYDELAIFEAMANALVHRDYSIPGTPVMVSMYDDRLEIQSPGSLPNTMTLESMQRIPMPRNDLLVAVMSRYYKTDLFGSERYLIEGRLFGVEAILERSLALSGRLPLYELIDSLAVRLTLYPALANTTQPMASEVQP